MFRRKHVRRSGDATAMVSNIFFIFLLSIFSVHAGPATNDDCPKLDAHFLRALANDGLVLQANFQNTALPVGPGYKNRFQARLSGTCTSTNSFDITFINVSPALVRLGDTEIGRNIDGTHVTVTPDKENPRHWHWAGDFECGTNISKIGFIIGNETGPINLAWLGDCWVVAGGYNVGTLASPETATNSGYFTSDSGTGLRQVICLPGPLLPPPMMRATDGTNGAPALAASFATALAASLHRPIAVYTIQVNHATYQSWNPGRSTWRSLQDWIEPHDFIIGFRGAIWWWGESEAESTDDPDSFPHSTAWGALPSAWAGPLTACLQYHSSKWVSMLTNLTQMIVGTDSQIPDDELGLVVQLQAVNREPLHAGTFGSRTNAVSSWETFRYAQNQAVQYLTENQPLAGHYELIPASPGPANNFPERWFWPADAITFLGTNLAIMACQFAHDQGNVKSALPSVSWPDARQAVLTFKGPICALGTNAEQIQFCTSTNFDNDAWTNGLVSTNTDTCILTSAHDPITAVRYGVGNSPHLSYAVCIATNEPLLTIPAFEFIRP